MALFFHVHGRANRRDHEHNKYMAIAFPHHIRLQPLRMAQRVPRKKQFLGSLGRNLGAWTDRIGARGTI